MAEYRIKGGGTLTDEDVAGSVANADSYLGLMTIGQADPANQG